MHKLIILNGPPGSGKNTIGDALAKQLLQEGKFNSKDILVDAFADYPKAMAHRAYGLPSSPGLFETSKDKESPIFFGYTPREMYIYFSEKVIKPLHGKNHIAEEMAHKIQLLGNPKIVIITDGGFTYEVDTLINNLTKDYTPVIISLKRNGCTFDNDSREYYDGQHLSFMVHNNGTVEEAIDTIRQYTAL